jgi:hypothetical protein
MSADPKAKLAAQVADEPRQVYLRDGRTLTVDDTGSDQLVEIRAASGALELRIQLTEAGPVLQMESVRLQLRATEAVEIASKRVEITATEGMGIKSGGELQVSGEADVKVDAKGEVRINGAMIYLN